MIKIIPILLGVVGSYIVAVIANACGATVVNASGEVVPLIDFTTVSASKLVGLQQFVIAKFDLTAILVMAPIAVAAMMEHIGDMSAISATVGSNFIESPGLHRTLIGDGIATSLAGLFGGPANTTYGENTGVLVRPGSMIPAWFGWRRCMLWCCPSARPLPLWSIPFPLQSSVVCRSFCMV